ncbi:Diacylglycerol kinase [Enhygromyxa salina]|uniref:Diacylglycerol kinase n=1 Tax=Enhygromyxa salina TaxID=215803 RepID=A0A2S9YG66_9BACT|nr:diacylglycerol kinase family protein [Enhygromyxa salina]PRQ04088.1 Diacylglycerol kinase [Enhygromyxa salina]
MTAAAASPSPPESGPKPGPIEALGKTTAIINPMASSGAAKKRWEQVREVLEIQFPGLDARYTEEPGHASELCREALEGGADTILSVGGDGTTNEVLAGFVDQNGNNRFPRATLAILAAGTGGDFQRMFGRGRIQRQVERLVAAQPRLIDYGLARYTDVDGRLRTRPFLNVASVGVSGEVVRRVNQSNAQLGATFKYLVGTLKGVRIWRNVQVMIQHDDEIDTVPVDGEPPGRRVDLTLGIVGNGQYFGAGMWVCPDAKIDDGQFDCIEVTGMSRTKLTATLAKVFRGKHLRTKGIAHHHATRVAFTPISDDADVPIEIDGEQVGRLPARFELKAGALRVRIG